MEKEDREFREYLEANGYDTSQMGLRESDLSSGSEESSVDEKKSDVGEVVQV